MSANSLLSIESGPASRAAEWGIAIRDDDTCFYTRPSQLEALYGGRWERFPVSLSVIPFAVPAHRWHRFSDAVAPGEGRWLHDNRELVVFLREHIAAGHIEIMLHGFSHEFKQQGDRWIPECLWKPADRLTRELREGKDYLEETLRCSVKVFVPPGNAIGAKGVRAIEHLGLQLSGLLARGRDRPLSASYCAAFARRWGYWLRTRRSYPFPLEVGTHRELVAYALTPRTNTERFASILEDCALRGAPFVLSTHYWEFERDPGMLQVLELTLARAAEIGCAGRFVSDCIAADD